MAIYMLVYEVRRTGCLSEGSVRVLHVGWLRDLGRMFVYLQFYSVQSILQRIDLHMKI